MYEIKLGNTVTKVEAKTVWACFQVIASTQEEAEKFVQRWLDGSVFLRCFEQIPNVIIFSNPAIDKLYKTTLNRQKPTCADCGTVVDVTTCKIEDEIGTTYELLCPSCAINWAQE